MVAKQKIEIDCPEGWECVCVEPAAVCATYATTSEFNRGVNLVFRKAYVPPAWLKPGTWLFRNGNDIWCATDKEPELKNGFFWAADASKCNGIYNTLFPCFVPPPTNPYQIPPAPVE